jgi:hypothetical protein
MHRVLQLHIMIQLHNISYIMIKGIHESSRSILHIVLNISSSYNKFHLLEILINTLYTLTQTLQPLIQFFRIMSRHKSPSYKGFYLIPSVMTSDGGYDFWIEGVLDVLGLIIKILLIRFRSFHLVLKSLENLMVCECLGKGTSYAWKRRITPNASYLR